MEVLSPFEQTEHQTLQARPLLAFDWLGHGFGTRAADPPFPAVQFRKQLHSDRVFRVDRPGVCDIEGDALVTDRPGLFVGVRTADCVPLLFADPVRRAVAAVHAGWRGTVQNIVTRTVGRMREEFGSHPSDLHVAIGPFIGNCCFEVGEDVAALFRELFPERDDLDRKTRLDLGEANWRLLLEAGVPSGQVYRAPVCTYCKPALFHSFRREGAAAGRMLSVIGIRGR